MKCTIHSEFGSIMVIPREDNMVRLYIQIASSTDADFHPRKTASAEEVSFLCCDVDQLTLGRSSSYLLRLPTRYIRLLLLRDLDGLGG